MHHFFNYSILFLLAFLMGCSSVNKTEVTGLCGSCKPYYSRGAMYYPQTYYEYDEVGLASWYGPRFHGKPKPLGEPFNQHTMTAAHATLPLPTIVKVTNMENGKSVEVLVDDRGPFVYDGRIIDLSMEAAKKLGSYQKGIAKVRVESLVEESKALSNYLAKYGHHMRKDKLKRTWLQIYEQEIKKTKPRQPGTALTFVSSEGTQKAKVTYLATRESNLEKHGGKKTTYISLNKTYNAKNEAQKAVRLIHKKYPARLKQHINKQGKSTWTVQVGPFDGHKKTVPVKKQLKSMGYL